MLKQIDEGLFKRLQAASYVLPVVDVFRDLADDVSGWTVDGLSDKDIDKRIVAWLDENGFGFDEWKSGMIADGFDAEEYGFDYQKLWTAYGVQEWAIDCVRSIAFTDEPIAFLPFAAGVWLEYPNTDPPMLIAVMTPLSDPDLAARQIKDKFRKNFGAKASKASKRDEIEAAKMLMMKRQGMSLREIAIQNLRSQYPDILTHERRYRPQIAAEKSRVAKRTKSVEETWNERGLESSTAE